MTSNDFAEWLDYHDKRFVGVSKFVDGNDAHAAWNEALKGVSFKHAKRASQEMFDGTIELPGFSGFSAHPRMIINAAKRYETEDRWAKVPEFVNDGSKQNSFTCYQCGDTGVVQVYHPQYYPAIRAGRVDELPDWFDQITVACPHCKLGAWKVENNYERPFVFPMFECKSMDKAEVATFCCYVEDLVPQVQDDIVF